MIFTVNRIDEKQITLKCIYEGGSKSNETDFFPAKLLDAKLQFL